MKIGAIVLAAGGSMRLGEPKQLLLWKGKPFVWHVVTTAIQAGLDPIIVVTGSYDKEVQAVLCGLPITLVHNDNWQEGQGSSIRAAVRILSDDIQASFFLLVDQPQINQGLITALLEQYCKNTPDILAPKVGDQRGNPVLFDRKTFPALKKLRGNQGGRSVFKQFKIEYLPWTDKTILLDIDTKEDYQHLTELE